MRLTLRTLLAYLDDTLEPTEIRQIGQKVAESDAAQELIARIKQITRRRRLTTPPLTGPGAANFDPNTVAEYLDNALSSEQLADVEKICLESDVHLAEIATCHQILTLVLGEPALVPPTARERMYGLVQGKESIPFRKAAITTAPAAANISNGVGGEVDEPFGLTLIRRGGWPRWAVPAAGVLLIAALVFTLLKVMPDAPRNRQQVAANTPKNTEADVAEPTPAPAKEKEKDNGNKQEPASKGSAAKESAAPKETATKETTAPKDKPAETPPVANAATTPADSVPKEPIPTTITGSVTPIMASTTEQVKEPGTERVTIGTYAVSTRSGPTLLVQSQNVLSPWRRLTPGNRVSTTDALVSLPGFLSDIRLASGVHLQLRGLIPEFATDPMMTLLLDSAVVLHPSKDVDLDFTLKRGRVYISNHKEQGPARVRLRFEREVWDLTLAERDTEVIVELIKRYSGDIRWQEGEEPWAGVFMGFLKGKGRLKAEHHEFAMEMPGPAFCSWDNKGAGLSAPIGLEKAFPQWDKSPPTTKEADGVSEALEELSQRMTDKKSVDVVLLEGLQSSRKSHRLLAIYGFGAVDDVARLLDVLGDEDPNHGFDRITAASVLRQWMSRGSQMGKLLFDPAKRTGLLTENHKYTTFEAETVLKLLYGYSDAERRSPDTYRVLADYLTSARIAIRELAYGHLYQMGAPVKFDPSWPEADRQKASADVYKLLEEHKLPPQRQQPPGSASDSNGKK